MWNNLEDVRSAKSLLGSALLAWGYFRWGGWRKNPLMMSRAQKG
jgi:hypothetical protein